MVSSLKELRILLPLTLEEYHVGSVHALTSIALEKFHQGKPVIVYKKHPFDLEDLPKQAFLSQSNTPPPPSTISSSSTSTANVKTNSLSTVYQAPPIKSTEYALKKMWMRDEIPAILRAILPESSSILQEESWSYYPFYHCSYENELMGKSFGCTVDTIFAPIIRKDGSKEIGFYENIFGLSKEKLRMRKIVMVDFVTGKTSEGEQAQLSFKVDDPSKYQSKALGRGPVTPDWYVNHPDWPVICCYKLISMEVSAIGAFFITPRIESSQVAMACTLMRRIWCTADDWADKKFEEMWQEQDKAEIEILEMIVKEKKKGLLEGLPESLKKAAHELYKRREEKKRHSKMDDNYKEESIPINNVVVVNRNEE